ncbi:MAG TPA: hypothetical protein ENN46_04805 [Candidatus Woesearchaeota archaeon]|nr:hypothetical protein [Candidatus Woesearchaeota archaeon]
MAIAQATFSEEAKSYLCYLHSAKDKIQEIITETDSESFSLLKAVTASSTYKILILRSTGLLRELSSQYLPKYIILRDSLDSIDEVCAAWDTLSSSRDLVLVFFSGENRWLLKPYLHNQIFGRHELKQKLITIRNSR